MLNLPEAFSKAMVLPGLSHPKNKPQLHSQAGYIYHLVGGLEPWNFMTFHSVGNFIIQTVTHSIMFIIFQRGRVKNHQPANQMISAQKVL